MEKTNLTTAYWDNIIVKLMGQTIDVKPITLTEYETTATSLEVERIELSYDALVEMMNKIMDKEIGNDNND